MEQIKTIKIEKEQIKHQIYCDYCKKFIGSSIEYDDGYYEKLGEVEEKVYIYNDWYKLNKTLCEDCKNKFYHNLIKKLIEIGFEREEH